MAKRQAATRVRKGTPKVQERKPSSAVDSAGAVAEPAADGGASSGPVLLADLRSPQFADAVADLKLVMIPVGAHEQHGPALPVSTDTISAQVLCGLAAAMMGPSVAVAPAVPWGVSWHHLGFPGTISIRDETLTSLVEDIVVSLHGQGIERFMLVNTHGGNNAALQVAAERCHRDRGVPIVASVYAYSLIANAAADELGPDSIGHGGGDESAVVLATRPDLVDAAALGERELNTDVRRVMAIVRAAGGVLPIAQDRTSESGASGDSSRASADAGSAIIGKAASQLGGIADELIRLDITSFLGKGDTVQH